MLGVISSRAILGTFAACVLGAIWPATALGASVAITSSPDPVEEVTYQLSIAGTATSTETVFATVKATGGRPCGANYAADDGTPILYHAPPSTGPFGLTLNRTTYDAGSYLVCAWVGTHPSAPPTAVAELVIAVRAPASTASVAVPARVGAQSTVQIGVIAQTEVSRLLFVGINAPGIPCAANYAANRSVTDVLGYQETTGGPFTYTRNVVVPRPPGLYSVCGYVQEQGSDAVPEATFGTQFTIFSYRCPKAQRAVPRHRTSMRTFRRKLRQAHRPSVKRIYRSRLRTTKRKLAKAKRDVVLYCR